MIDYIFGNVIEKRKDSIVLDANSIGYSIMVSDYTLKDLSTDTKSKIYIDLVVREDSISMYGFSSKKERDVYKLLTTVKSIGPKVAIGIFSKLSPDSVILSIKNADLTKLTTAPGIGKKTAERIVLELKDKIENFAITESYDKSSNVNDAIDALLQLGYSNYEIENVFGQIDTENKTIEELIRLALRYLSR